MALISCLADAFFGGYEQPGRELGRYGLAGFLDQRLPFNPARDLTRWRTWRARRSR